LPKRASRPGSARSLGRSIGSPGAVFYALRCDAERQFEILLNDGQESFHRQKTLLHDQEQRDGIISRLVYLLKSFDHFT
jgi:hypothetical protein